MSENVTAALAPTSQSFPERAGRAVVRRWPAWLGIGLGLLSVDGLEDGVPLGVALASAAFGYLLVALVGRPETTWPGVFALGAGVVLLRAVNVPAIPVFSVAAAGLAVVALLISRPGWTPLHLWQIPAAWLFGGAALVATLVSTQAGSLIVAVGLIAHAGWDTVLWRARRPVVSRSFLEWCAAFDLVVGVGIIAVVA